MELSEDLSARGFSQNINSKHRNLDNQFQTIMNNKIVTRRRSVCIVTLASRIDSAMINTKNTFDMAQVCEPTLNENYPIWKLWFDAASELNQLKKIRRK